MPRGHAIAIKVMAVVIAAVPWGKISFLYLLASNTYLPGWPLGPQDTWMWGICLLLALCMGVQMGYAVWGAAGGQPLLCHHTLGRHVQSIWLLLQVWRGPAAGSHNLHPPPPPPTGSFYNSAPLVGGGRGLGQGRVLFHNSASPGGGGMTQPPPTGGAGGGVGN